MSSAPLLALDTSGPTARVALISPQGPLLGKGERTGERHSAYLLPLCHELLTAAGLTVDRLGGLACGRGPGSFTGLRVGLAVAKGLALPFDLPLHLVSSLEALALDLDLYLAQQPAGSGAAALLVPVIDAGKGEVYGQLLQRDGEELRALSPESRLTPPALVDLIRAELAQRPECPLRVGGTGVDRHASSFRQALGDAVLERFPGPTAESVARLARQHMAAGRSDDLSAAVPSYGRPPDITKPRPRTK